MNYQQCKTEREALASFMRRLYKQKLTTCSGGNLSVRLDNEHIIITPSGLDKGMINSGEIGLMTMSGDNLTPHLKPSMEAAMHVALYKKRPDIKAIVHAHPVTASSFSAMKCEINRCLTAEAYLVIGQINYAPYALMGSEQLSESVAKSAADANTIVMENHGIVTLGATLLAAYDRMEVLEAAAQMTINVTLMKSMSQLTPARLRELDLL